MGARRCCSRSCFRCPHPLPLSRPTSGRCPERGQVSGQSPSTSLAEMEATGRASVAPYGVWTSPSGWMHAFMRRSTSAGTGAPAESTRRIVGSRTPWASQYRPTRSQMAGEPNAWVTFQSVAASMILVGSTAGGPRRVHVGNDGRHAHRAIEQAEQRKGRQIDFARPDAVEVADLIDLGVEIAVGVEHAFGRAGAAGGKNDRRRLVGRGRGQFAAAPGAAAELAERTPPQNQRRPTVTFNRALGKRLRQQAANGLNDRNRHEPFRLGLGQAADEVPPAHARIDQDGHGPGLEQPENQRDEIDPRPHQQDQPRPGDNAQLAESPGDPVAILVELAESDVPVEAMGSCFAAALTSAPLPLAGEGRCEPARSPTVRPRRASGLAWAIARAAGQRSADCP